MWTMLAWCATAAALDMVAGRWLHAGFAAVTAAALAYAVTTFIGVRASLEDTFRGWSLPWVQTPAEPSARIGDRPAR
jgi:hypothetical protein